MIQRIIPATGESLPVIGMGTYKSFDVTKEKYPSLVEVLENMHACGGRLLDSSPMYVKAEEVIGNVTHDMPTRNDFFYATKVWTEGRAEGIKQMEASFEKMQRTQMDLMQIHNLLDWKTQLDTLKEWKAAGKIRYIGITYHLDEKHHELEAIFTKELIDFVQVNYSITGRNAEKRLLQAAADQGVATLINRPLGFGKLFTLVAGRSLPDWASEFGIDSWSQYFLKYIISHPAVTCVIPATSNPQHALDNYNAATGILPDSAIRQKMVKFLEKL